MIVSAAFVEASPQTVPNYGDIAWTCKGSAKSYAIAACPSEIGTYSVVIRESYKNDYGVMQSHPMTIIVRIKNRSALHLPVMPSQIASRACLQSRGWANDHAFDLQPFFENPIWMAVRHSKGEFLTECPPGPERRVQILICKIPDRRLFAKHDGGTPGEVDRNHQNVVLSISSGLLAPFVESVDCGRMSFGE